MNKLIIEARVNEYAPRGANPRIPFTAAEIAEDAAACREAGAAVVHFHARGADGAPDLSPQAYAHTIGAIRDRSDILVNPTLGSLRRGQVLSAQTHPFLDPDADPRLRPDLVPLCLSSPNWDFFNPAQRAFAGSEKLYLNSTEEIIGSARAATAAGIGLACVCWEVGATRRLAALADAGFVKGPLHAVFHLTSGGMLAGHPGTAEGLQAHLEFLPTGVAVEWAVINLHGSMFPLLEHIIGGGGHVQIGLGDHPYAELGQPCNADLVRHVADTARRLGREIATPQEARALLMLH